MSSGLVEHPGLVRLGEESDPAEVSLIIGDDDGNVNAGSPLPTHDIRAMDLMESILLELRKMNAHLASMTDEEFETEIWT